MQKNLENSYLFKATDVFYPAGTTQANEYPQLTESGLKFLESGLQQMLGVITDLEARNAQGVSLAFKRPVTPSVKATVVVANLNKSIAQSVINEKGVLEIRVDVHVLQATFRGSLLSVLKDSNFTELRSVKVDENKTDDQLIADFLEFKRKVIEAKTGNIWGDVWQGMRDDSVDGDRWSKMLDLTMQGQDVQATYLGALMFLMAHEVGHLVLGHHQHSCDPSHCERFSNDELEADRYAGYLLGAMLAPISVVDESFGGMFSDLDPNHSMKLTGFTTFFDDAYSRVGFVDANQSPCHCAYPETKARHESAQAGQESAVTHYQELLKTDPSAAQNTTPVRMKASSRK